MDFLFGAFAGVAGESKEVPPNSKVSGPSSLCSEISSTSGKTSPGRVLGRKKRSEKDSNKDFEKATVNVNVNAKVYPVRDLLNPSVNPFEEENSESDIGKNSQRLSVDDILINSDVGKPPKRRQSVRFNPQEITDPQTATDMSIRENIEKVDNESFENSASFSYDDFPISPKQTSVNSPGKPDDSYIGIVNECVSSYIKRSEPVSGQESSAENADNVESNETDDTSLDNSDEDSTYHNNEVEVESDTMAESTEILEGDITVSAVNSDDVLIMLPQVDDITEAPITARSFSDITNTTKPITPIQGKGSDSTVVEKPISRTKTPESIRNRENLSVGGNDIGNDISTEEVTLEEQDLADRENFQSSEESKVESDSEELIKQALSSIDEVATDQEEEHLSTSIEKGIDKSELYEFTPQQQNVDIDKSDSESELDSESDSEWSFESESDKDMESHASSTKAESSLSEEEKIQLRIASIVDSVSLSSPETLSNTSDSCGLSHTKLSSPLEGLQFLQHMVDILIGQVSKLSENAEITNKALQTAKERTAVIEEMFNRKSEENRIFMVEVSKHMSESQLQKSSLFYLLNVFNSQNELNRQTYEEICENLCKYKPKDWHKLVNHSTPSSPGSFITSTVNLITSSFQNQKDLQQEQLEKMGKHLLSYERSIQTAKSEICDLKTELNCKQHEFQQINQSTTGWANKEIQSLREKNTTLTSELRKRDEDLVKAESELSRQCLAVEEAERNARRNVELLQLESQNKIDVEIQKGKSYSVEISNLEKVVNSLSDQTDILKEEKQKLFESNSFLGKQLQDLSKAWEELEGKNLKLENSKRRLEEKINELSKSIENEKEVNLSNLLLTETLEKEKIELLDRINLIETDFRNAKKESDLLKNENISLVSSNSQLSASAFAKHDAFQSLQSTYQAVIKENMKLQERVENATATYEKLVNSVARFLSEFERITERRLSLTADPSESSGESENDGLDTRLALILEFLRNLGKDLSQSKTRIQQGKELHRNRERQLTEILSQQTAKVKRLEEVIDDLEQAVDDEKYFRNDLEKKLVFLQGNRQRNADILLRRDFEQCKHKLKATNERRKEENEMYLKRIEELNEEITHLKGFQDV